MKRIAAIMMVLCVVGLAGCNTMSGLGKDIEKAGGAIQRKADK